MTLSSFINKIYYNTIIAGSRDPASVYLSPDNFNEIARYISPPHRNPGQSQAYIKQNVKSWFLLLSYKN